MLQRSKRSSVTSDIESDSQVAENALRAFLRKKCRFTHVVLVFYAVVVSIALVILWIRHKRAQEYLSNQSMGQFSDGRLLLRPIPPDVVTATPPTTNHVNAKVLSTASAASHSNWTHIFGNRVFLTVRDRGHLDCDTQRNLYSWIEKNPDCDVYVFDDKDIDNYFKTCHKELLPLLQKLTVPVQKTDIWRYSILHTFGGVYADSDVQCKQSIALWKKSDRPELGNASMVIGVEGIDDGIPRFLQFVFAAAAGHPALGAVLKAVEKNVQETEIHVDADVLSSTGPGPFTEALREYLVQDAPLQHYKGQDLRINNVTVYGSALSAGWGDKCDELDPVDRWTCHGFYGSWKRVYYHRPKLSYSCWQQFEAAPPVSFSCKSKA